jgi:hypothetical protein
LNRALKLSSLRRMKRPSHATAIAYLALFIALGSGAYAATQLPKNSVGPKQLKKKAVTTTKLKDGAVTAPKIADGAVTTTKIAGNAVTGAKVDEASLAQVPSAAVAGSATTAASAADASTLGGIPSSGFQRSSDLYSGFANPEIASSQPLFTVPGKFQVATVGDGANAFKVRFTNISSATWSFHYASSLLTLEPGVSAWIQPAGVLQETVVAFPSADPGNWAVLDCAYHNPPIVFCVARVSPSA